MGIRVRMSIGVFIMLTGLIVDLGIINMGKKDDVTQNLQQKLNLAIKSGKYKIGYKLAQKQLRNGTSKLMVIANNCPAIRKTELEYLAILGGSKVLHWDGNNVELGTACGRLHRVCVMTIQDAGDSDILTSI